LDPAEVNIEKKIENFLGGKPEVVMEAIGNPKTESESLNLVKPGGTVIWFGVADPKAEVKVNPFYI